MKRGKGKIHGFTAVAKQKFTLITRECEDILVFWTRSTNPKPCFHVSIVHCNDLSHRQHAAEVNYNEQVYNFLDLASCLCRGMLDNAIHYNPLPSAENRIHMVYSGKEADTEGG